MTENPNILFFENPNPNFSPEGKVTFLPKIDHRLLGVFFKYFKKALKERRLKEKMQLSCDMCNVQGFTRVLKIIQGVPRH
jgi:hypothetical protein